MKKFIKVAIVISAVLFEGMAIQAQKPQPTWIPTDGYWVVVLNVHARNEATVRFYDNGDQLLYEEVVPGKKLRLNSRKTKLSLKNCLEQVIAIRKTNEGEVKERELVLAQINRH